MAESYAVSTHEQNCTLGGQTIRGVVFRPEAADRAPLVICSHGFASTWERLKPYAQALAEHGAAAYAFDFRGGGDASASDGATTDMSVMTEAADLEAVLRQAESWPFVDSGRVVLLGASQGGYVSAVVAARPAASVAALILLYPAFVAWDDMHKAFGSLDKVPENVFYRERLQVGRRYFADIWDCDPYAEIGHYGGPVLIIHGTCDSVVPVSYSERARSVYPDAELILIKGAGHGFSGRALADSIHEVIHFLEQRRIVQPD